MYLSKLLLQNFRSYHQILFDFEAQANLILGLNGTGKTNILEAIFLLATGKSFRSGSLSQMMYWQENLCCVRARVVKHDVTSEIEVQLIKDPGTDLASVKRRFLLEKVPKTRKTYLSAFNAVVFNPEDIRLVNGSPSRRRDFLDNLFIQIDWRYASALSQYTRALKHRNELLDLIREGQAAKAELFYWDQSLTKNANIVHDFRTSFFRSANAFFASNSHPEIRNLALTYHPSLLTLPKLESGYQSDLHRGYTQSGIHRDDYTFDFLGFATADKNLAYWGSRGQQRLAVLALKLAEIDYLLNKTGFRPVLLLDDIFSELDTDHQKLVTEVCLKYQTIITSSDREVAKILPFAKVISL